jgi:hypothetical protein
MEKSLVECRRQKSISDGVAFMAGLKSKSHEEEKEEISDKMSFPCSLDDDDKTKSVVAPL